VTCKSARPLFAYIAPYRSQAKSVAWSYLKHYARPITEDVNESELIVRLKYNGAEIRLFGADNPDSIRGLGFDGVLMDEYGDFKPSVFPTVVRPALSDKQGWGVFMGTPKGKNQFWDVFDMAQNNPAEWFCLKLKASESGILPQGELDDARRQMSEDQYLQEYEVSFDAAILGAFYGTEMRLLEENGHITKVDYDPSLPCYTAWDIGHTDDTSIWWFQMNRGELRIIDFYSISGSGVEEVGKVVRDRGYHYEKHFLPHDAKAKTFSANGKSTIEQLVPLLGFGTLSIVPMLSKQDGIQAVRMTLPNCYFDAKKCKLGIEALKQYEREYDEDTKAFRAAPKHNWCFVGETEVLTRNGTCQIMNLPYSGEVLTSCGWKRYLNPRVTRKSAPLVEVLFKDGLGVKCTPDHTFKTASGWTSAEHLEPNTPIQSASIPSPSIGTVASIASGLAARISQGAEKLSIALFGLPLSAKYQMAAISTTGTLTELTIDSKILSACLLQYISAKRLLDSQSEHSTQKLERLPPHGIDQTRGDYGIKDMLFALRAGLNGSAKKAIAPFAKASSTAWFVSLGTLKSIARWLVKPQHRVIAGVRRISEVSDVWCLTVPGAEEFSLANGALVHNCSNPADAFRYLALSWREETPIRKLNPEVALVVGPGNTATLEDLYASQRPKRRQRI